MTKTVFAASATKLTVQMERLKLDQVVPQIFDVLWTNQKIADAYLKQSKGWEKQIAGELSISPKTVQQAIAAFGETEFKEAVANNPAGKAPVADRPLTRPVMYTYYCEGGGGTTSVGCGPSVGCGTNSTCSTCNCPSNACNSQACPSNGCQTGWCIVQKMMPKP